MNSLTWWKLTGIIAINILGFLLHYLYSWTGKSSIIGLFVPVNESVWEHLKLSFWSVVLFSIAEYFQIKNMVNNYYLARLIGVLALELTIIIIFYGYTSITGTDFFMIDIFSFITGVINCQYLTYRFLRLRPFSKPFNRISFAALIAMGVLFGVATYYPPHISVFRDNNSKTYGIEEQK